MDGVYEQTAGLKKKKSYLIKFENLFNLTKTITEI